MKAIYIDDDFITVARNENDECCEIYGSVREVYGHLYHKTLKYIEAQDMEEKESIAKEIGVLSMSLDKLGKTAPCAATVLNEDIGIFEKLANKIREKSFIKNMVFAFIFYYFGVFTRMFIDFFK